MLTHKITYTNFDNEEVTEELYFNINKIEILDLEVRNKEGLERWLKTIIAAKDQKTLWEEIKRVILLAYGEKSPDGRNFIKIDPVRGQLSDEFAQSAAFDKLMWDLVTGEVDAGDFMIEVMPKDLASEAEIAEAKKKAQELLGENKPEVKDTPTNP